VGYRSDAIGNLDGPSLDALQWVLSSEELSDAGLTQRQLTERVAAGFLFRKFRGVYAVGRSQLNFEGNCRAAWLACGKESAVSHISAARDWNFRQSTGRIHISVPRGRAGHPGLIVHRPRSLPLDDIVQRDGYAVTSVARTILDMAPGQSADTVAKWMHQADVAGVLDLREVWACCERLAHHRGRRIVEAALAVEVLPTRSGLEEAFLALVRAARFPTPEVNAWLSSGERLEEVDFAWPGLGLIVEADSVKYHSSEWRKRRDREKADRFRAVGWTVWRVPELAITLDPGGVARQLAALGRSN
jgi:very-short-patch-repair endonuclease